MKEFKAEAFIDGKSCGVSVSKKSMQEAKSSAVYAAYHAIEKRFDTLVAQANITHNMKEGEVHTVSAQVTADITLVQTCVTKHRTPARAHEVIQKEREDRKARVAQAAQEAKEYERKRREKDLAEQANLRQRVKNQIDHAFKTGVSGSEPAAKYITCFCNAPAAVLILSRSIQPGATALDEDTILDARCQQHNHLIQRAVWNAADIVECSRLEFFYDGVRQITIKAGGQ